MIWSYKISASGLKSFRVFFWFHNNLKSWTKVVETHENYQPFSLGVNSPFSPRER